MRECMQILRRGPGAERELSPLLVLVQPLLFWHLLGQHRDCVHVCIPNLRPSGNQEMGCPLLPPPTSPCASFTRGVCWLNDELNQGNHKHKD